MGTDIHACVECKIDGCWTAVRPLDLDRNYNLFAILAGVRRDHEPIAEPRGLPADRDPKSCTSIWHQDKARPHHDSKYDACGSYEFGDHTRSWLLLSELLDYDWDKILIESGVIPLRDVDCFFRGTVDAFYKETYAEWCKCAPHPPAGWCGGLSNAEILDLRPRKFLTDGLSHFDRAEREAARQVLEKRDADIAKAQRYLGDSKLFPEPEEPPPGAIIRRPGMSHGWLPGKRNPRTAWARVAWSITAREACRQFCAWLDSMRDVPGGELRIVFGFDS